MARDTDTRELFKAGLVTSRIRKRRCENCIHFASDDKECRIRAPAIIATPQGIGAAWPPVRADRFCGEHLSISGEQQSLFEELEKN